MTFLTTTSSSMACISTATKLYYPLPSRKDKIVLSFIELILSTMMYSSKKTARLPSSLNSYLEYYDMNTFFQISLCFSNLEYYVWVYHFFPNWIFLKHIYISLWLTLRSNSPQRWVFFYAYLLMLKNLIHFCPLKNKHPIPFENYMFFNVDVFFIPI